MEEKKHTLVLIILNWNNSSDTIECIRSIKQASSTNLFLILIDNGSNSKNTESLKNSFSDDQDIEILYNDQNFGFTKAHNKKLLLLLEREKYVFLLNNDTIVEQNLPQILENQIQEQKPDILSCKMVNYWDRNLMDNAGHKMLSSGEIIPVGHGDDIKNYNDPNDNIGACAGAALYSSAMLKDIGLFDEYFETGYEDAELGLRAFVAGYRCQYEPNAVVYHKMGQSIKKVFNYNYTLRIQTNIFYTYLKLVHWQVMAIHFIPWLLRFLIITVIDIVFWRPKYLKVQYHALSNILFRDWKTVMQARRESKRLRRIPWWKLLKKQEFFLKRDIQNFYTFIIKGEKSYFEKY